MHEIPTFLAIDAIAEQLLIWHTAFENADAGKMVPADWQVYMDTHEANCQALVSALSASTAVGYSLPYHHQLGDVFIDLDSCADPGEYRSLVRIINNNSFQDLF